MDDYDFCYKISVSIDNINSIYTKADKFKLYENTIDTIVLSVDELMVYADYFDNPLKFLHYLGQRKRAIFNTNLYMSDELAHLGAYVELNWYSIALSVDTDSKIMLDGYQTPFDLYYGGKGEKPLQPCPKIIDTILDKLIECNVHQRTMYSSYLLDFNFVARNQFQQIIEDLLLMAHKSHRSKIAYLHGEDYPSYCVFCNIELYDCSWSFMDKKKYVYNQMFNNKDEEAFLIDLTFDEVGELKKVRFLKMTKYDISIEPRYLK